MVLTGKWSPRRHFPSHFPPSQPVRRRLRRPNQRSEMEVPVRQQTPIPLPGVPRDRVLQHWRRGGIEHTVALLEPGPIQHAKTGGMKRTRRLLVPLVAARRFLLSGVEIPAQFVEMGRSKRGANL